MRSWITTAALGLAVCGVTALSAGQARAQQIIVSPSPGVLVSPPPIVVTPALIIVAPPTIVVAPRPYVVYPRYHRYYVRPRVWVRYR